MKPIRRRDNFLFPPLVGEAVEAFGGADAHPWCPSRRRSGFPFARHRFVLSQV
ncbi:MAG TPA: hypothetical protein VHQ03_06715 [Candidatus Dormibacteraeota bacterium]|nr:hypothetical protein [Candidatus Dormibacteraeota bacterium]